MTNNSKVTWKKVAKTASKEMKSPKKVIRTIAASDLSQVVPHRETSKKVASKSAKILPAKSSTKKEKQVSASVLSQTSFPAKRMPKKKK